jgi:coproporphyrinogen III oxidase-like Fe-S oxidoreductase
LRQINPTAGNSVQPSGMNTAGLIARYDVPVPRYTSYPTAPQFSAAVDGAVYAGWLAAMAQDGLHWDGRVVRLSATGRPFVRNVAAAFDRYLRPEAGRHARAV